MKKEILEKIRNIIVNLFVLFIFILIMAITFVSLRVRAAYSDYPGQALIYSNGNGNKFYLKYTRLDPLNKVTDPVSVVFDDNKLNSSKLYGIMLSNVASNSSGVTSGTLGFYEYDSASDSWSSISVNVKTGLTSSVFYESEERYGIIETNLPVFISSDGNISKLINYFRTLDDSDSVNKKGGSIDNPDFQDTAYAFTGFTANSKMTATWTGTTERSYLKDEDVEEYVRVSYGFAAKDAPDSIKQVDNDSKEYSTAAKSLTVKVSDLVPDDDSWFLRYVQVIPCYRQAGLGVWGDFYHGVACKIYFNQDGSIDKIVRDFPQGSGDYSYKHIFSSDKYSNEIPAPELSAISHNGFTLLNNSNNDYYVDIILESNLYGVKMEKNAGTWLPVVDTDWIYNSHYYNFADTSQIAINNDVIYIPNLFSANPESDLVDDFKKWSSEYSSYSSLPSMSFLKRSTAARTRYVDQFLFKDNSKFSDSEQLRFSHMAESVFYVRYYNKSMVYGPWVRYKFRDGYVAQVIDGTLGGAYIDVGQVDTDDSGNVRVDENGNPIVSDNVSGRQDYDTGESDFSDGSFSLDLSDVTKFFDYLKKIFESVTGALSSFGSVVAACFGFLPGELVNALIFGICVMMFIGIIKAVKG